MSKSPASALGRTVVRILEAVLRRRREGRRGQDLVNRPSPRVRDLEGEAAAEPALDLNLHAVVDGAGTAVELADAAEALMDAARIRVPGRCARAVDRHVLLPVVGEVAPDVAHVGDLHHQVVRHLLLQGEVVGLHRWVPQARREPFREGDREHEVRVAGIERERKRVQPASERGRQRKRLIEVD